MDRPRARDGEFYPRVARYRTAEQKDKSTRGWQHTAAADRADARSAAASLGHYRRLHARFTALPLHAGPWRSQADKDNHLAYLAGVVDARARASRTAAARARESAAKAAEALDSPVAGQPAPPRRPRPRTPSRDASAVGPAAAAAYLAALAARHPTLDARPEPIARP